MLPTNTAHIPEGTYLDYFEAGPRLTISYHAPTRDEINQIKRGDCHFRLVPYGEVLFLLSKFGSLNWMDSPFNIQLYPSDRRVLNAGFSHGKRYSLVVRLVDGLTGLDRGARLVTWNPEFSSAFHKLVAQQKLQHFESLAYDRTLSQAYSMFSTTSMMTRSISHTKGGM